MEYPLLEKLNEEQKKAVLQTEGPVLILAGAGSGKTRVITHRIAHLILDKGVSPYSICALTFTNKAAAEMKERVIQLIPNSYHGISVKTFHSLCLTLLRSNADLADLKPGFTVYDTSLQESLLKDIIKSMNLDTKVFIPSQIANRISHAKDSMILPDEFGIDHRKDFYMDHVKEIYKKYEDRKKINNAVDFGDLILKTVLLFKNEPSVIRKYNLIWKYIMIDEYQDTNKIQYELTKLLAGDHKNICVVGDDDQSIYSWRGADIRNILFFEKDFPDTFTVKLEENYRSFSNIIQAASSVIQNNSERKDKKIFSNKPPGDKIRLTQFYSEHEEANAIVKQIQKMYKEEKSYTKFVIFYRTNAQSRYFEESLRSASIPYKIFGGFRFFDRMEIKDVIAYLSVIVNPGDDVSLLRIINSPPRGIGDTSLERIKDYGLSKGKSLLDSLNDDIPDIRKATYKKMKELYNRFHDLIDLYKNGESPSKILIHMLESMGIHEHYQNEDSLESSDRLENIEQFVNAIKEYEENVENPSLSEYLNDIVLLTSEEEKKDLSDYVTLMTVHNSKGLEFDYVFLTGMEEGTFPHRMSMESESEIEEERRLCYVAITRAKVKLFISHASFTRKFGMVEDRIPSRFLKEIPVELFENSKTTEEFKYSPDYSPRAGDRKSNQDLDTKQRSISTNGNSFRVGDRVKHKDYGVGKIMDISGSGDNLKVKIAFGYVHKNFLLAYTKLEKIT
ncbi:MAG TPA: 3'-5' exonuclease [Leptospiraceae bacterium]|nr:3'-5' exonuclease [Leptospiraceae bacterium]HMW05335.1 3'-5' exonuclease [Leptospiraceae bacterium]HMX32908.1 3'-5' exonuclease [Leptospiraceae bacterium]HMY31531.1 3'-5' exonuclease [Leptospiraceae bacterium]HMZ65896.1 3'-5' exonuclease [Leptospiraceae bacterium]